jgi:uncharacterized membrane protein YfcA
MAAMTSWLPGLPEGGTLAWLIAAALASGLARGFSGFGAALIFVPLASIAVGPQRAAPLMMLVDILSAAFLTPGAWREAERGTVGWLAAGAAIGTPFGIAALLWTDPLALRWAVSFGIIGLLALLVSGWRFAGRPGPGAALGFGTLGGFLGGVAMMSGPPAMTFLLGRDASARQTRADFALYLAASGVFAAIGFLAAGLLRLDLLGPFLVATPIYLACTWLGAKMFWLASEVTFRRACYAMIALAAIIGLPAWDGILR